jgi:RNA polymerase sigma-70 factor (ECF subfamily)
MGAIMAETPATRASLLVRIRDAGDAAAWGEFVEIYAPLVYGFARRRGLQDADAADVTQDVLRAVSGAVGRLRYDPRRGSFRSWLFTVARSKLNDFHAERRRHPLGGGDSAIQARLEEQPACDEEAAEWDREYETRLLLWAADRVRGQFQDATWRAFWQTAVEGKKPADVAESLGLSVGAVYIAKSRVVARLRDEIEQLPDH